MGDADASASDDGDALPPVGVPASRGTQRRAWTTRAAGAVRAALPRRRRHHGGGGDTADADDAGAGAGADLPDEYDAEGWNPRLTHAYKEFGLNLNTFRSALSLWFAVLVCASFALVFTQYGAGLYLPVFVPGALDAIAAGAGLLRGPGFLREDLGCVALGGAFLFVGLFPACFALVYVGQAPFDRLFVAGPTWDGSVITKAAASSSVSAAVFGLQYATWIACVVYAIGACVMVLYMLAVYQTYNGPDPAANRQRPLWQHNWPHWSVRRQVVVDGDLVTTPSECVVPGTRWRWRTVDHIMRLKFARVFCARFFLIGVVVSLSLAITEVAARNAGVGAYVGGAFPRSYSWVRATSPQFTLIYGVAACVTDHVPYWVRAVRHPAHKDAGGTWHKEETTHESAPFYTRHMGGRASHYYVTLLVLVMGSVQSLFFIASDAGGRLAVWASTYQAQIVHDFPQVNPNIGGSCFANVACYQYANPVYDGDVTYTLNRTSVNAPQSFGVATWQQDVVTLLLLVPGLCVTLLLGMEVVLMRCTNVWRDGLVFTWTRVPSSWLWRRMNRWAAA